MRGISRANQIFNIMHSSFTNNERNINKGNGKKANDSNCHTKNYYEMTKKKCFSQIYFSYS